MTTLSSRSFKLRNKLYLNVHSVVKDAEAQVTPVQVPVNHVFCCDVSGSMYGSLPKMRTQLKNRISEIVKPEDTITIIAFSSPTVCYVLKELAKVNTPQQLSELQAAIDRYLVPNGWTDFVPPIKATEKLITANASEAFNWIFLSDGGHNEGPFSDVVNALEGLQGKLSNATVIEYGYYADSARLSEMAELLGGTKIQAEDFDSYVPTFEAAIQGTVVAPMVKIDVTEIVDSLRYPQFIYIDKNTNSVHVVSPKGGSLVIPSYVDSLATLSKKVVGSNQKSGVKADVEYYYAMAYVMADLLNYDTVEEVLASLGDTKFIDLYQDAFGKQKLFAFQSQILNAIFNDSVRGEINDEYTPVDNSYCVIDFFNDLMTGDNQIKVVDQAFAYKRIGAKAVDKVVLTESEKAKLSSAKTKKDLDKVMAEAQERTVKMSMINKGYPVSDFTWNEERANLSALMKIDVILDLPKNDVGLTQIQSFVFRNYTIIKDGILNINSLPVILDEVTFNKFKVMPQLVIEDVVLLENGTYECTIDISALPVINRKKVRESKKKRMTKLALQLNDYKFQLKYLGYLKKELGASDSTTTSTDTGTGFTAEQWTYLESLGITHQGYQPKKEVDKNGDYYMALTLNSTFKGFSSIPAIEAIDKKLKAGKKLTPSEEYLQKVMAFVDKKYLGNAKSEAYKDAIRSAFNAITIKKRKVAEELSQMKFAMIISRKWFSDCESFDDNIDTIVSDFGPELTIEYRFVDKKQNL